MDMVKVHRGHDMPEKPRSIQGAESDKGDVRDCVVENGV